MTESAAPKSLGTMLQRIPQTVTPAQIQGLNTVVAIRSTGTPPEEWTITVKDGTCTVDNGRTATPQLSVEATPDVWQSLIDRKLDAEWAYMSGKLRVSGDLGLAMRLQSLLRF
jgi:putative sterol carrier protein